MKNSYLLSFCIFRSILDRGNILTYNSQGSEQDSQCGLDSGHPCKLLCCGATVASHVTCAHSY